MKNILSMLLIAIFAMGISGCENKIQKQAKNVKELSIKTGKADIKATELKIQICEAFLKLNGIEKQTLRETLTKDLFYEFIKEQRLTYEYNFYDLPEMLSMTPIMGGMFEIELILREGDEIYFGKLVEYYKSLHSYDDIEKLKAEFETLNVRVDDAIKALKRKRLNELIAEIDIQKLLDGRGVDYFSNLYETMINVYAAQIRYYKANMANINKANIKTLEGSIQTYLKAQIKALEAKLEIIKAVDKLSNMIKANKD